MGHEVLGSRSIKTEVEFKYPFKLGRDSREFSPGIYTLHTHEDVHQGRFDPIYVAVSVELVVSVDGKTFSRFAKPEEIRLALAIDANRTLLSDGPNETPDRMTS
ncbi:MAG: hypothetical protein J0J06_00350 [Sphingomonas sp.]|uniref:hypothetical protein n=1 Tax=Sphingomonas sp. TaxID=28214 RepID=UPI001AC1931E|nr:hypothetical protein [Sphingomonas sp.]MBN8813877.1 hypothetical protein [Sphingomonas sp.]